MPRRNKNARTLRQERQDRRADRRKDRRPQPEAWTDDREEVSRHKPEPIVALTRRQGELLRHLNDDFGNGLTFALGPAGTGKTYPASATAADKLAAGKLEKLILCRPAVGADEEHGFLPGDINKKLEPWTVPITEVVSKRVGKVKFESFLRAGRIEIVPFAYMRGRTFTDAFVILDEAQNTTYAQMKMFLTRIGEGCTVLVNGDVEQTDLKAESGLAVALRIIREQNLPVPVVEFTTDDVVRSGICRLWTEAFIQHEKTA